MEAKPAQLGRGFIFTVHHPVIIKTLGIQRSALASEKEKIIRIALHYISQNNFNLNLTHPATKIASVTFHGDLIRDDKNNRGYVYKKLSNPLHLAQGFEGMVLVEKGSIQDDYFDCEQSTIWKHGNLFTISNVVTKSSIEVSVEKYCVLSSFGFTIKDIPGLEKKINKTKERTEDWNKYVEKVYTQLQRESVEHGDILFLDMVDVYRNLPQKMFLFYKWLFKNYNVNYVLKTDDDVFVDILKVQREIEKQIQWDWWSCFRIDWPVKRGGKWQETFNYKEEIYPPFPTGAGYVLSEKALDWLRYRLDTLSVEYQGEDVAMGIWLEGLEPTRHTGDACYWACVDQCHAHSCNTIQLSVADMYSVWNSYQECGQMCGCSALS
ncbi:UDP-GalNAc:beta-1,3-N-acetylgalactosaminyltransferase 2-like [Macrosteles quadrilineatus]|uniref:UDP-GalNAc:beta-1, 3-N-acetylgalactosaminyltransferase 2-like n=1 Tax=Macrosteles quadrilineatus TaxID=74068 RepID=UPI0023E2F82D|nr:UDP-GalNAc:beta-1,3-N-acetylgalactosaminyltransferase 2-like [Macrosteles quadrilineatus]